MSFKKQSFIYHMGTGVGFYSEFNNMVLCMISCLQQGICFNLYSQDAFFFDGKGWKKYFKPFCKEKTSRIHHFLNRRVHSLVHDSLRSWISDKCLIIGTSLYKLFTGNFLTQDLFFSSRTVWFQDSFFDIPKYNLSGDLRSVSKAIIEKIYVFNDYYSQIISSKIQELRLPNEYIGIHIRGGDKITEKDLFGISDYMVAAEKVSKCRNAFILTDDYRVIEELKVKYPEWTFYTLTFPDETGYVNSDFESKSIERREKEMLKVFASVEIIRNAIHFVGTYSSNVGMFLGMVMPSERITSLDSKDWYIL